MLIFLMIPQMEFHGVEQVVFQKSNGKKETDKTKFTIEAANKFTFNKNVLNNIETFQEPSPQNDIFNLMVKFCMIKWHCVKHDKVWTITNVINENMPTWNGYNSLTSKEKEPTIIQFLSLYPGLPTDWSNLYSALKQVQEIATTTMPNLQLCDKCMRITDNPVIRDNFIYHLGELHIVFAMLKLLGKYVIDSGLNET